MRSFVAILALFTCTTVATAQVQWQTDLEAAKRTAAQTNKLVLLHFWASWCKPCMVLEHTVFNQPGLGESLSKDFVAVKVNVEHKPTTARKYGVTSIPADVIITPDGKVIEKLSSPRTPAAYAGRMQKLAMRVPNRGLQAYAGLNTSPGVATTAPPVANAAAPPSTATPAGAYGHLPAQNTNAPLDKQLAAGNTSVPSGPYGQPAETQPATADNKYSDYAGSAAGLASGPSAFGAPAATQPPAAQAPATQPPVAQAPAFQQPNPPVASRQPTDNGFGQPPQAQSPPAIAPRGPAATAPAPAADPKWGMDAFCPVTLNRDKKWVPGDRRWGVEHQGVVYLFTNEENKKKFLADPNYYAPVLAGHDPVLMTEQRKMEQGRREHGVFYRDRVYMFSGESTLEKFSANPARYAAMVAVLEAQVAGR
ncbi:MAG: thioredoxin family protein [Pirellulales bacterium]|nr:thioredoxin family protein [Pirellulales bacterium]